MAEDGAKIKRNPLEIVRDLHPGEEFPSTDDITRDSQLHEMTFGLTPGEPPPLDLTKRGAILQSPDSTTAPDLDSAGNQTQTGEAKS